MNNEVTSAYIWVNMYNRKTYASKDEDIAKCFDKAIEQCGHKQVKLEYIVSCDVSLVNKLIKDYQAIVI